MFGSRGFGIGGLGAKNFRRLPFCLDGPACFWPRAMVEGRIQPVRVGWFVGARKQYGERVRGREVVLYG